MLNIEKLINGTIISINDGKDGCQPIIVIRTKNNEEILLTATPNRRFKISLNSNSGNNLDYSQ